MTAIAGEGTAMERDYDYSSALHGADLDRRGDRSGAPPASARSSGSIRARSRPSGCRSSSTAGWRARSSAISPARSTAARSRARRASSRTSSAQRLFRPGIRIVDDPLRKRGLRSRPFDGEGVAAAPLARDRGRRADVLAARLRDRARARLATTGHAQRGVSSPPSPGATNLHLEAGSDTARGD